MMIENLLASLEKHPADWELRRVIADWYEENGELTESFCFRWTADNEKRPYSFEGKPDFVWFNADGISPEIANADTGSDIPKVVFNLLKNGEEIANHKGYASFADAEKELHLALLEAKKQGKI